MQAIKIFKLSKAQLKDVADIKQLAQVFNKHLDESILVLVDAIGTTIADLEELVDSYFHQTGAAFDLFEKIKQRHYKWMLELFPKEHDVFSTVSDTFMELEWVIEDQVQDEYDYLYDQMVSIGTMIASQIIAAYLNEQKITTLWLDVRDAILTDNNYRNATIDLERSQQKIIKSILPNLKPGQIVLTQNNMGGTSENFTTTLGTNEKADGLITILESLKILALITRG